jgi:hypothetical protein
LFLEKNGEKPYDSDHYIPFAIVDSLIGLVMPFSLPIRIFLYKKEGSRSSTTPHSWVFQILLFYLILKHVCEGWYLIRV